MYTSNMTTIRSLLCVFLYLVGVIQAANTTTTTTSDSFKTLWSIVSSSVLTLFACVYSAIHANIPSPKDSPNNIILRRLGIMIMALIAPELIVTWAMRQWLSARQVTRQFKKDPHNVPFGPRALCFLLIGKCASFPGALAKWAKKSINNYFSEQFEDYAWTQTHSFFVLMGGYMLYVDGEPYLTLRPDDIEKLTDEKCIVFPTLTARQIHDRSKGNAMSKGLVVLQVAWFVMQLITRAIYHLETTQLEIGTLAFAVLNFLTYAVWWDKPLNVQCPHPVYWKSTESKPENYIHEDEIISHAIFAVIRPILELIGSPIIPISQRFRVPTFDGSIGLEAKNKRVLLLTGLLMATIFGGIHCMAWYFAFSTYQEQVLWRMSAVAITFTPWLCLLSLFCKVPTPPKPLGILVYGLYVMLYITSRTVLLVLMFTTLRNLPSDAYKAISWTSLVPHL
ncbi:hypothetical protein BDR07DRAFT_1420831 [Suillus spraguei]|nr:hypothetical protein BDR07DRAFT_1420831 [Suillus spraguei]